MVQEKLVHPDNLAEPRIQPVSAKVYQWFANITDVSFRINVTCLNRFSSYIKRGLTFLWYFGHCPGTFLIPVRPVLIIAPKNVIASKAIKAYFAFMIVVSRFLFFFFICSGFPYLIVEFVASVLRSFRILIIKYQFAWLAGRTQWLIRLPLRCFVWFRQNNQRQVYKVPHSLPVPSNQPNPSWWCLSTSVWLQSPHWAYSWNHLHIPRIQLWHHRNDGFYH